MRIAALIQAHHRPDLLGRLVDRLNSDLWQVYVHVDKKSNVVADFSHLASQVRSFESVYRVYWAGFSHVLATIYLLRRAIEDPSNSHFYLMSGQCFPVKTDEQIATVLKAELGNFITVIKMPVWHKPLERLTHWHFHDLIAVGIDNEFLKKFTQNIFNRLSERKIDRTLRGLQPYGGSTWWLLKRETASAVVKFVDTNTWLLDAFKWSYVPEEMLFQTIIGNIGIRPDRMSPTFAKWIDGMSHPLTVDASILQEAKASWHLMARKFDLGILLI